MTAIEVLPLLIPTDTWFWGADTGTPLGVHNIKHYLHREELTAYTTARDAYRAQNVDTATPWRLQLSLTGSVTPLNGPRKLLTRESER